MGQEAFSDGEWGWETLAMGREGSGKPLRGTGGVGRPSQKAGMGREDLPVHCGWSGGPLIRIGGVGGPPIGPVGIERPSQWAGSGWKSSQEGWKG